MNTIKNNYRKSDIKKEDDKIYDVGHSYVAYVYKDLLDNILSL